MRFIHAAWLAAMLTIAGCSSPPPFDASSPEAAQVSIETIKSHLSADKGAEFEAAVMMIGAYDIDHEKIPEGEAVFDKLDYKSINGLTVDQIIAKSKTLRPKTETTPEPAPSNPDTNEP